MNITGKQAKQEYQNFLIAFFISYAHYLLLLTSIFSYHEARKQCAQRFSRWNAKDLLAETVRQVPVLYDRSHQTIGFPDSYVLYTVTDSRPISTEMKNSANSK